MNMVSRAADGLGDSIRGPDQAAKIFMQTSAPATIDERVPVFRAEHNVEMQA